MSVASIEDAKQILEKLVAFPTISHESNLSMVDYMADFLRQLGARVFLQHNEDGRKANLFATLGPQKDGGIVLSGHSDVVPVEGQDWSSDPFMMLEINGRLYGRGTCDMKGFLACCLAVARETAELNLERPLHFAFTYDEEVGCFGAQALVREMARRNIKPAAALIGEPTMMQVIEGHKGCYEYTTNFVGLDGHGSQPDRGINAIQYATRFITYLMELGNELKGRAMAGSRFDPPWATIQVGRILGGAGRNIIAGHCSVEWEMRPVQPSDAAFVKESLDAFINQQLLPEMKAVCPNCCVETILIGEVEGLQIVPQSAARDLIYEITGANGADVVAFGTEAGLFQKAGISAIICGPGSIEQAHKPNEFVDIDQLKSCLKMLSRLQAKLV
ncbi:acetylornithine deacetylase [Mesorhizobium sp. VK25A]|uniref:Acetylornithine deacetylase n=1 Tax=Mesorhizobium vachelliae TaxID=3072309 RepID=A0ABU5AF66_9HYPH|nr:MULTISPECIES: acetylornithine deacetylase [unclassified Mesorhizobium]MDX8535907.1 acetylornithine deacetylase [Mesorhizobium sp. VK25D]MDX8548667.1 acetylornithine deacetylase [Mesorhizobium sp. VK25A]